ncbi:MAG: dihydropteroate synthase, partial [Candidatus Altiarchaeota archaeon]|nr:dihydropteroate synthase [Candidatus Altiarchaeota archaeon]
MGDGVLLVTGRKAAGSVRRFVKGGVHVCSMEVAALLSAGSIGEELSKMDLSAYSMVIVPGLVSGDVRELSKLLGVPVYKGTRHSSDIPALLENLGRLPLSTTKPADELLAGHAQSNVKRQLAESERHSRGILSIGRKNSVIVGSSLPMRVVAEIPDAPLLSSKEISAIACRFAIEGADIIDIGMMAGADYSDDVKRMVKAVRSSVSLPVSIDSMRAAEIRAAAVAGVDMVLSIGENNITVAKELEIPFVVVPTDARGRLPESAAGRVRSLCHLAKKLSGKRIIFDPVLNPLMDGFAELVKAYSLLKEKHPEIPVLMGAGNVTELVDADSPGVNAVLAGIA